jgi:mannose-6-phosphate isomerase
MKKLIAQPYLLENPIQFYNWGTRGTNALIPKLLGIEPDNNVPYAELWIGAHPSSPSNAVVNGARIPLTELIGDHPVDILGDLFRHDIFREFPFLLKVLSIAEPLSIQAHPNKHQAQTLRAQDPHHYPDDNHKPEIAIALDELTLLAGFKQFTDMERTLRKYPEISVFIGMDGSQALLNSGERTPSDQQEYFRSLFSLLLEKSRSNKEDMTRSIDQLVNRFSHTPMDLTEEEMIFTGLQTKYPDDVGLFFVFLLNLIKMKKGEGIFIAPGIPHAYIQGNIVECMATSDNVIRAGLTPKFKDHKSLIGILNFEPGTLSILQGETRSGERVYRTPAKEFTVRSIVLENGETQTKSCQNTPEVLLITDGTLQVSWQDAGQTHREYFHRGQAMLIPANLDQYKIHSPTHAEVFRVTVPNPHS